jgi:2-polyprenyl-6-methoxyphenol hydroxylase-like FAD-dependent oxidoreductase
MYDAIIVGARCAGAPTAMLLARKGYKVLMVDRDTFPSDIMSTHYIHQPGVASLKRWGLLDEVAATNCPPITTVTADMGPIVITGSPPPAGEARIALCPRRRLLDKILIDAAIAAGAEIREGVTIHELTESDGTVTGVRGRGSGASIEEQARIVIGADGVHSIVARAVHPDEYEAVPSLSCGYYSYFSGVNCGGATIYYRGNRLLYSFPTNDGLTCIAQEWPVAEFHAFRSDIEGNFMKTLQLVPAVAEAVAVGRREERFEGTADVPNFFRRPFGPGWALVGDAGYHKDPVTGQGITDALRDSELLANAIDAGFSGREPLEQALAGYEQRRNAVAMPIYQLTLQQITYELPPPEMLQLFAAVAAGPQVEKDRFVGMFAGTTSIPEYMAPENLQQVVASAGLPA